MRVSRAMLPLAICVAVLGCRESIGENTPRDQVAALPWNYPVYEMTPSPLQEPGRVVRADGRVWHAYDAPHPRYGAAHGTDIPQVMLRQVASYEGTPLHALTTDASPYTRLYSPLGENRWRVYLPAAF
jgi:hypothetical protein